MKRRRSLHSAPILAFCIIVSFTSCRGPHTVARTNPSRTATLQPPAPTGFYTLATDLGYHYLTISLEGTGEYQVTSELLGLNKFSHTQKGRWTWDPRDQEFLLTPDPASEGLGFEFRRLRMDNQNSDTLLWLPLQDLPGSSGPTNYVRFHREP